MRRGKVSRLKKLGAGVWLFFFVFLFVSGKTSQSLEQGGDGYQPKILIFINWKDLMCANCLNSFVTFFNSLPSPWLRDNALGILVGERGPRAGNHWPIMAKKIRGFIQANQLSFPIWIDQGRLFKNMSSRGTCLLIMGEKVDSLSVYSFPLFPRQEDEIRQKIMGLGKK